MFLCKALALFVLLKTKSAAGEDGELSLKLTSFSLTFDILLILKMKNRVFEWNSHTLSFSPMYIVFCRQNRIVAFMAGSSPDLKSLCYFIER